MVINSTPVTPATASRSRPRWWWVAGLLVAVAGVLLLLAVPAASGATWTAVAHQLRTARVQWLLVLPVAWWAGLYAHSLVLTASLPGLSSRRAIGLNLAGSAVGNAVPLGGPLSLALTSTMVRSWNFTPSALGAFLTISTVWNLLVRVVIGVGGLVWVAATLPGVTGTRSAAWIAGVAVLVLAACAVVAGRDDVTARLGARVARLARTVRRNRGSRDPRLDALVALRLRRQVVARIARSWRQLSLGMVGYLALLAVLLWCCLRSLGTPMPWTAVMAAVALERLVTAIPLTPGGAGVAEIVLTSCLALAGAPAADAAAAALLYRGFTFLIEIPLGLAVAGTWGLSRWRTARPVLGAAA